MVASLCRTLSSGRRFDDLYYISCVDVCCCRGACGCPVCTTPSPPRLYSAIEPDDRYWSICYEVTPHTRLKSMPAQSWTIVIKLKKTFTVLRQMHRTWRRWLQDEVNRIFNKSKKQLDSIRLTDCTLTVHGSFSRISNSFVLGARIDQTVGFQQQLRAQFVCMPQYNKRSQLTSIGNIAITLK